MKKQKKALSVFLGSVLVLNTAAMIGIKASSVSPVEASALRNGIIEKAAAYLGTEKNADGSYGDDRLVNDTTEALIALRAAQKEADPTSEQWLTDNVSFGNTDMTARLSAASAKSEYLGRLECKQNSDGGFGLYPEYASDVLDSLLVLEAVNDTAYTGSDISGLAICEFLVNSANENGSYSYTEASDSDDILTAMVVYNVGRFLTKNNYELTTLEAPLTYLRNNVGESYADEDIKKTLYKELAIQAVSDELDPMKLVNDIGKAEKTDGSFAGDIETTSVAIRLLQSLDLENRLVVTDFESELSDTKGSSNSSNPISVNSVIEYTSNYDAELDVKVTAFSGETPFYENTVKASCPADGTSVNVASGEFVLAEPDGSDVYVLVELYDNGKLVKSQKIAIDITAVEPKHSTEITDLSVELDTNTAVSGAETEVGVSYDLLYATNVDYDVTMKTVVTRSGKEVASKTEEAVLIPDSSDLKGTPLSFTPDTTSAGVYDITVVCIDGDKEICRRSTEFRVVEAPVIEEKTSEDEKTQFEVTWFGPILSDYYVYAGNETGINAGAEINYFSNGEFTGKVEMNVYSKDELVDETSFDVTLEKGEVTYFDSKAIYPVYKSGDKLSFSVKNVGEYTVNAKLCDSEDNVIAEGKRVLKVVDRPVQDLILNSSVDTEKKDMVDLSWNDISSDAESYSYQLYRKANGTKWEPRSIWNEEEHINVLNVYPAAPYLAEWMTTTISDTETPAGKGIFDIDSVHIPTFNSDPKSYLLDSEGNWKYDVIFFGSSDCNSGYDLNEESLAVTKDFVASGRGVLFGHDTICGGSGNMLEHRKFNQFAEEAGLLVATPQPEVWYRTTSVSVVKLGTLTNYPWTIRGDLTVPNTHSTGQYLNGADEWITLNATKRPHPETGGLDNFYLSTYKNVGMIQTGDSNGQASDDERKILANTLFYLYQISQQTTAKDASFYDVDAPDVPELVSSSNEDGKAVLNVQTKDNPTDYEYYISANPISSDSDRVLSNVRKHTAFADLAGFVVKTDSSSEPKPELIERSENGEDILGIVAADSKGRAALTAVPTDLSQKQYIHIFAVDNAGNISEELIVPFADDKLTTEIGTDKKLYSYGDTVAVDAETLSAPFGRTADMAIEIFDEFDNKTAMLTSAEAQVLNADVKLLSNAQWTIPQETEGRYKAVISWKDGDEVIASAESEFKIANEVSVSNLISSDKRSYSLTDPINLANTVSNNSKAMTENDLVLNVVVTDKDGKTAASFRHDLSAVEPAGTLNLSDAIESGELSDGDYKVKATVTQGELELSSDEAEFTVVADVTSFTGKLDLSDSDDKGIADFTVKNSGNADAENAVVSVKVYKDGESEPVYTYSETVSIEAGKTYTAKTSFDLAAPSAGKYSGVLSVEYKDESSDLDYDGFENTYETTTTVTTTAATASTTTTTVAATENPKTGDSGIPIYMWLISSLSLLGLVTVKLLGGKENE
ncbi:MAG: hypothetical protein IKP78_01330 [Ruminococcus sp.]|nr:hypothetical protein [Ruminococcus sp.]